jgi:hypothetical protein
VASLNVTVAVALCRRAWNCDAPTERGGCSSKNFLTIDAFSLISVWTENTDLYDKTFFHDSEVRPPLG